MEGPEPGVDRATHIDPRLEQFDPGEAVSWPVKLTSADDPRDGYFMVGKFTRVEADS